MLVDPAASHPGQAVATDDGDALEVRPRQLLRRAIQRAAGGHRHHVVLGHHRVQRGLMPQGRRDPAPHFRLRDLRFPPAVDLLVAILGGQRSSRLVQSLREQRGLAVSVDAGFTPLAAAGAVVVTAQVDPANLRRAEEQILDEIRRVREDGVTPAELRRAITKAEAEHEFATETAQGRAVALGRAETIWTVEDELAYVSRLRSVAAEQVRAVARRYLDPDRYTRLALVPPRTLR